MVLFNSINAGNPMSAFPVPEMIVSGQVAKLQAAAKR